MKQKTEAIRRNETESLFSKSLVANSQSSNSSSSSVSQSVSQSNGTDVQFILQSIVHFITIEKIRLFATRGFLTLLVQD